MVKTSKLKAVVFDAYGTLFDVYSIATLSEELFPGNGFELAEIWRDRQIEYSRIRTMCAQYASFWDVTENALEFACEKLSLDLTNSARASLMRQYSKLKAFPENIAALSELQKQDIPLAILSNGTTKMIQSAVDAAGMKGLFDHILSVEAVQKFKTAPEAYQLGPDTFKCPVTEILFVSSNGWDICGATWFGYTTFWVNRAENPPERLGVHPTAEGRTLDDVVRFVANHNGDTHHSRV
jgi:2-haloacid dehalogenase